MSVKIKYNTHRFSLCHLALYKVGWRAVIGAVPVHTLYEMLQL